MTVHFQFNTDNINQMLSALEGRVEDALRPTAQAGAQVYYEALLSEYDRLVKNKTFNLRNAIYQAYRDQDSSKNVKFYGVSWAGSSKKSQKASQHGHLIEFGHMVRYQAVKNRNGEWVTAVRPEKRGLPAPKRSASQAEKDAYYVLRRDGPYFELPRPFMRNTMNSAANQQRAYAAMAKEISKRFGGGVV